ncbi:DUF2079 domain-containing protein [Catenulispora yoronensis]|uniref:DUF2079 domain-containing protein n=1 Tax=Catenulispora yoronensis TaxID=450799 RepID=UPI0031E2F97A
MLYKGTIGLITPEVKATTLVMVLAPTAFLALRSSLVWVALPTLVWRFAAARQVLWGTGYHYSLVLMPVVFAAFIEALAARRDQAGSVRGYVASAAGVCALMVPQFPFWQLVQSGTWHDEPRLAVARRLMNLIPDGATVQASSHLAPQLTNRATVGLFGWEPGRRFPQWIVVDAWTPPAVRWPLSFEVERNRLNWYRVRGYRDVADQDGYVLLARGDGGLVLSGSHVIGFQGRVLAPFGGSGVDGAALVLTAVTGGVGGGQEWGFVRQDDGSYALVNGVSGLCVDVGVDVDGASSGPGAGARVIQRDCSGRDSQHWYVTPQSGGGYLFTSVSSGLQLTGSLGGDGDVGIQDAVGGFFGQEWSIG